MAQAAKMDFDRGGTMAEEEVEEGGGGGKKLIIIIIVVLVLLIGGALGAYFAGFLPFSPESDDSKVKTTAEETAAEEEEENARGGVDEKASNPGYYALNDPKKDNKEYITNLMDGRRFIVVKLAAEYEKEDEKLVVDYLDARRPLIDDIVLSYLSTLDSKAAQHRSARETMKKQLKRKLNKMFDAEFREKLNNRNPIKQIVIQKFILQ